jgi:hypothetical protein
MVFWVVLPTNPASTAASRARSRKGIDSALYSNLLRRAADSGKENVRPQAEGALSAAR